MIVVSVMYPASAGAKFDMDYYRDTHIPMVRARWNASGLRELKILHGSGAPAAARRPTR